MKNSLWIVLFLAGVVYAQEVKQVINEPLNGKTDYQIDWQYKAGEYLIYDCERAHFACVDRDGQEQCNEARAQAKAEGKELMYPCAVLKRFNVKWECVQDNYKVVYRQVLKRFCYPK